MKIYLALIKIFLIILLLSCNNKESKNIPPEKSLENTNIKISNNSFTNLDSLGLELNNGVKWKVDSKMMVFLRLMENDINNYIIQNSIDYKNLKNILNVNITNLTSNCTMSGKAHDQLHLWLVPFIEFVDGLNTTNDENLDKQKLKHLKDFFIKFNVYFK